MDIVGNNRNYADVIDQRILVTIGPTSVDLFRFAGYKIHAIVRACLFEQAVERLGQPNWQAELLLTPGQPDANLVVQGD